MRKLKFHEKKLLKKVDFFNWKNERNLKEISVVRRYHLQDREDYSRYSKICGLITSLVSKLKLLKPEDPFRIKLTEQLLEKLYNLGLIPSKQNLAGAEKIAVSQFCRRRLPIILQQMKFCETNKEAVTFIEQGHVRIGTEVVNDPALIVSRNMADHITWVDSSSIKRKIMKYNDQMDDYDLLE